LASSPLPGLATKMKMSRRFIWFLSLVAAGAAAWVETGSGARL